MAKKGSKKATKTEETAVEEASLTVDSPSEASVAAEPAVVPPEESDLARRQLVGAARAREGVAERAAEGVTEAKKAEARALLTDWDRATGEWQKAVAARARGGSQDAVLQARRAKKAAKARLNEFRVGNMEVVQAVEIERAAG